MSEFRVNSITNQDGSAGPQICGVSTFSGKSGVQIPSGSSEFRRLDGGGRGRGVFVGGGYSPTPTVNTMNFVEIATTGNASDFGDISQTVRAAGNGTMSNSIRALNCGGARSGDNENIDEIIFTTSGTTGLFGDLTIIDGSNTWGSGVCSNSTRGIIIGGGSNNQKSSQQKIELTSRGNGTIFGDLYADRGAPNNGNRILYATGFSSSTVGHITSYSTSAPDGDTIIFYTFSSLGNAQDFGEATIPKRMRTTCTNNTRGIIAGGGFPTVVDTIEFVTMASKGNGTDFGNLTSSRGGLGGCSNSTRGIFGGGFTDDSLGGSNNTIDYITISTTGNATDFGDLTYVTSQLPAFSDIHGGLAQ